MTKPYNQYCPTARALDVLGGRWTLLVVRELLSGPKRYKDLRDGLPGIGTNLLAQRLHELEDAGVVQRSVLPPPAGSTVYELTARGRELEPAILAIARWGFPLLGRPQPGEVFRPHWAILALRVTFRPDAAKGLRETYEFRVGDEVFHVRVNDGAADSQQGPAWEPDLVVSTTPDAFLALASRQTTAQEAVANGSIQLDGDPRAFDRFLEIFGFSQGASARRRRRR